MPFQFEGIINVRELIMKIRYFNLRLPKIPEVKVVPTTFKKMVYSDQANVLSQLYTCTGTFSRFDLFTSVRRAEGS